MVFATITLIVVILFLSFYGKIKQGNAIPIIGSISALSLFAGLRDISFGPDLFIYQNRFLSYTPFVGYSDIILDYKQGTMKDALFYIIMKIFSDLGLSYQIFMATVTGFYIIIVSILIFKYSKNPIISFVMFISLSWLQFSFTGLRQTVAMGMCIIALLLLLQNKKSVSAILCIWLAGFTHSSAWIFLIVPVIARFNIKIGRIRFIQLTLASLIMSIVGSSVFREIVAAIAWNEAMANYADSDIFLNWTGFIIQLLVTAFSYIFYDSVVRDYPYESLLFSLMAIGVGLQAFSSVVAEMFRVSMYFSIASICVYPTALMTIKSKRYKVLLLYGSFFIFLFYFFLADKFSSYIPIIE
ncbi:EpsG family protein [Acidaminococcus fermentans]|uniref:EpsG family protein n=1 Tax=Acidaminococcus fermentans TaxID=905 RepID=UPI003D041165